MSEVRKAAVAGLFYPGEPDELARTVRTFLAAVDTDRPVPKAMIVPHAGYIYSGAIAASAYARLRDGIERVVLLGPAHRYPLDGVATHSAEFFATPLGDIPVERTDLPVLDIAHVDEHSLEVHLPFLQVLLGDFRLVPIVVGHASAEEVADVIDRLWGGEETVIVVSSDLSHYYDYATARRKDDRTARAIEEMRADAIGPDQACGCRAIAGLLTVAKRKGLAMRAIDLRNSGDTAGGRDQVVGYGAFVTE